MAYQLEKGTVLDVISLRVNNIEDEIAFFKKVLHLDVLLEENGIVYLGFKKANKTLISLYEDIEGIENEQGHHVLRHYKLSVKNRETLEALVSSVSSVGYEMKLLKNEEQTVSGVELLDPESNLIRLVLSDAVSHTEKIRAFKDRSVIEQADELQLQAVKVNVAYLEDSLRFYRDVLGFKSHEEVEGEIYQLSVGGSSHQLILYSEGNVSQADFDDQFYGLDYIAFKLPNFMALDQLQRHLKAKKLTFYYNKGKEILQIDDPNGIHLWFYVTSW